MRRREDPCGWQTPDELEEMKATQWKWPRRGERASREETEPPLHGGLTQFPSAAWSSLARDCAASAESGHSSWCHEFLLTGLPVLGSLPGAVAVLSALYYFI